jgi:hypothetical protein
MAKYYRKLTDTEKALRRLESDLGNKPNCHDLVSLIGGSPGVWGRILQGKGIPCGEYLAKIKFIKDYGIEAGEHWAFAEKSPRYGQVTRKGKTAPHIRNLFSDIENFREQQIFEKMVNVKCTSSEDYYDYYIRAMEDFYREGPHYPESYEEERIARKEYFDSLSF